MLGCGRGPRSKLQHQQQPQPQQPHHGAHLRRRSVRCRGLQGQQAPQSAQQLLSRMVDKQLQDAAAAASRPSSCTNTAALLDGIYDKIDDIFFSNGGFKIPRREKQSIDATGGSASYGEVEAAGVDVILRHLAMDSSSTFVDLGCGRGRAVLQVALHAHVAKAIGLELSDSRLEQAEMALQQLRQSQAGQRLAPVEFRLADLSSCSFDEGTHFYLCSTAFGAAICRSIAERLQASPSFQALVTSRQLPSQPHLTKLGEVPCEFSFNANGRAYIYVKSLSPAAAAVCSRLWCRDGVCWLPSLSLQQLGLTADEPVDAAAGRRFVQLSGPQQQPETATAGNGGASGSISGGGSTGHDSSGSGQQ